MKTNLKIIIAIVVVMIIGAFIYFQKPNTNSIIGCYVAHLAKDVFTLSITGEQGESFEGNLDIKNFEKDSSTGTLKGTYKNEILLADYTFQSEGTESVGQVVFKKFGNDFVRGYGKPDDATGTRFVDLSKITYDQSVVYQKISAEKCPVSPSTVVDIKQNVENYLRENISRLSPVKAVLGGTWYVVSVTTDLVKNSGTVTYEDGHIQEIKNFSFTTDEKGNVVILTITGAINLPAGSVACTEEAKLCPDGSAVGRIGPNCEFASCPNTSTLKSGITGTVTLSPTCPVERIPPDPNCAPKPYSTSINIMKKGSTVIIKNIQSDSKGVFHVDLAPGAYVLQAKGGNMLPRCGDVSAEVRSNQYTTADISCDTGIR